MLLWCLEGCLYSCCLMRLPSSLALLSPAHRGWGIWLWTVVLLSVAQGCQLESGFFLVQKGHKAWPQPHWKDFLWVLMSVIYQKVLVCPCRWHWWSVSDFDLAFSSFSVKLLVALTSLSPYALAQPFEIVLRLKDEEELENYEQCFLS